MSNNVTVLIEDTITQRRLTPHSTKAPWQLNLRSARRLGNGLALPIMSGFAGANDHEAHEAATATVQTVLPLTWQEAGTEAVNARCLRDPLSSRVVL